MTPEQRLKAILLAAAAATLLICLGILWLRQTIVEENKKLVPKDPPKKEPKLPKVELDYELIPKDEATSLLMATLKNTGDVPLQGVTIHSSMKGTLLPLHNFVYIDEGARIPNNGNINLTPSSTIKLWIGSVKIAPRLSTSFLKDTPKAKTGVLTLTVKDTPQVKVQDDALIEDEAPTTKHGKTALAPVPKLANGKPDKKAEREQKKKQMALDRERKKIEREEAKAAKKHKGNNKKDKSKDVVDSKVSDVSNEVAALPLNASFSIPLQHGIFTQAEAQMLYFYKRDLLFERADSKGEVFENTLTFDGNPTRNLYRKRGSKEV